MLNIRLSRAAGWSPSTFVVNAMAASEPGGWSALLGESSMIFVTVGSDRPFDRMLAIVDRWASNNLEVPVIGQIATGRRMQNISSSPYLSPVEFRTRCREAKLIVSHAGMGTVLSAREIGRLLIVFPRRAELLEHTSNHQMATAKRLEQVQGVLISYSDEQLYDYLDDWRCGRLAYTMAGGERPGGALGERLREYIDGL